jgi:hypothetical protein
MTQFARGDEALANRFLAETDEPGSPPAIGRLLIDSSNHLWVRQQSLISNLEGNVLDVFSPDGEYLGEVAFPARFFPYEIGFDYVLGVSADEDNVPSVQLFTLSRNGSSSAAQAQADARAST